VLASGSFIAQNVNGLIVAGSEGRVSAVGVIHALMPAMLTLLHQPKAVPP